MYFTRPYLEEADWIGVGEEHIFIYKPFKLSSLYACSTTLNYSNLWHVRLGHLSDLVLGNLLGQSTSKSHKHCNIF